MSNNKLKIEYVKSVDLIPCDQNPRKNDDSVSAVVRSMEAFGWTNPILARRDNNMVIAGHTRLKAAKEKGIESVPVIYLDLDETDAKTYMLADNRLTELAEWDGLKLGEIFAELDELNVDLELTGFNPDEVENYVLGPTDMPGGLTDDDAVPKDVETVCKYGDLWQLGKHRLLCGDSTRPEDVERLMDGQMADLMFTDPPYGVSYEGKTKEKLKIQNDSLDENGLAFLVTEAFGIAPLRKGAYCIATVPARPLHIIFAEDWKRRGWLRQIMVWVKDSMVLGHSEYHYKHEPILFGWVQDGERLKNSDRTKTTVWEFDRPKASKEHPTMKPVDMWVYGISNHSEKGDVFYDPFSGSGTSYIACEKTGRKCYGMEIDPHYCDVIIKRWEDYTGEKAVKHG